MSGLPPFCILEYFEELWNIIDMNVAMWRNILIVIVAIGIGILIGWLCRGFNPPQTEFITRTDTLTVRDTITEKHPIYLKQTKTDTMLVAVRDTTVIHDTTYIVMDREQKYYKGNDYEAWVSGYRPRLDSIWVFPETRYITKEVKVQRKPTRWGIGIQAGYGIGVNSGQVTAFPYIGVGISYNIVRF